MAPNDTFAQGNKLSLRAPSLQFPLPPSIARTIHLRHSDFPSSDPEQTSESDNIALSPYEPSTVTDNYDVNSALDELFGGPRSSLTPGTTFRPSLSPSQPPLEYTFATPPSLARVESSQPGKTSLRENKAASVIETCNDCGERFRDEEQLKKHHNQKHAPQTISCGLAGCQIKFSDARSRDRHRETAQVHQSASTLYFICPCGSKSPRKDHHMRHVEKAIGNPQSRCQKKGPFGCWCGATTERLMEHELHLEKCKRPGSRGRGRPRKAKQQERMTT
ncbi:hypothetical protein B0H67DRAFT_557578 [Lasiosphaeris hirsuta]|uniref:C2H2-type domain-containing protein n=1 Tax=Lasiosphaeris hirsuta TaxID=260670 RepID=A0AA40DL70_9PEZI|nr:hypothetical protein B0H67DRAFT_557578 [Lasiosphaeris hirsuta]